MIINAIIQVLIDELKDVSVKFPQKRIYLNDVAVLSEIIENNGCKNVNLELLKNRVGELLERRNCELNILEEDVVKSVIYRSVKLIFYNTTQEERFLYFEDLLHTTYDLLVQKLIQLKQLSSIISKSDFKNIVRNYIPFIKLETVLEKDSKTKDKDAAEELIEYLEYPGILREDTYEVIKKKLHKQNFNYLGFELILITERIGFLGNYAKLKIFTTAQGKTTTSWFFIKSLPKEHDQVLQTIATNSFIKEEMFYTKFIDLLEKMGDENFNFLPKLYLISENFIVLEDLSVLGYSSVKTLTDLDYKHCSLTIKQLAKMHSCSILLEELLKKTMGTAATIDKYFPEMIKETQILNNDFNAVHIEHTVEFLKKFPHIVKDITLEEFQIRAKKNLNQIFSKIQKSDKHRNVVNHGDIWWTNIFYKWDPNKCPTECLLLDFQLIRYVPPAFDILMFMHITTNRGTREIYMKTLIDEYYSELKSILEKYSISIEKILPYNDLTETLDDLKILGIYLGTAYYYINAMPKDDFNKLFSNADTGTKFWNELDFRIKMFEQVWDQMKNDARFEENALDLYEYCLKHS